MTAGAEKPDSAPDALVAAAASLRTAGSRPLRLRARSADSVRASVQWAEGMPCPSPFSSGKAEGAERRPPPLTKCPTPQAMSYSNSGPLGSRPSLRSQE